MYSAVLGIVDSKENHICPHGALSSWGRGAGMSNRSTMQGAWGCGCFPPVAGRRLGNGSWRGWSGSIGRSRRWGCHSVVPHVGPGCLLSAHRLIPAAATTTIAWPLLFPSADLRLPLAAPEPRSPRWSPPRARGKDLESGGPEQGRLEVLSSSHRPLPGTPPQLHRFPPPLD